MQCLGCGTAMGKEIVQDVPVDSCPSCAGTWLDGGEIADAFGLAWIDTALRTKVGKSAKGVRTCPRDKKPLGRLYVESVEVDMCSQCHGIWLDATELDRMASTDGKIGERYGGKKKKAAAPGAPPTANGGATRAVRRQAFMDSLRRLASK